MTHTLKEIFEAFRGKLVGTYHMKTSVCEIISLLPEETIDYVTENVWFIGSLDDAWAFTFTGNDLQGQHLIFVSDALLSQPDPQITYSIMHEIGHVMLGHRNSVFIDQSKAEIDMQEKEADVFAKKYVTRL